jgi:hypothetical protein
VFALEEILRTQDDLLEEGGEKLDDIIILLGEWLNDELLLLMLADGLNEVLGNPKRNLTSTGPIS